MSLCTSRCGLLAAGIVLATAPAFGQAPALTAISPARHAVNVPRTAGISLTFSQPVTGAGTVRIHSSQWRGYRAASNNGDGTTTLRLQPTQAFAPGELVSVTVPGTVQNSSGQSLTGGSQVLQFRAAAGPGSATFTGSAVYNETSASIYTPRLADVNNDGRLDFLLVDGQSSRVKLRLGDGRGNLGSPTNLILGQDPREIQLADFNNDGNLDLATAALGVTRFVTVALGSGTGAFALVTPIPATALPTGLQVGDVNGDGNQDLVFAVVAPPATPAGPASLAVHLGDGQGGFTELPAMPLVAGSSYPYLHDLNNDGRLDCVVGNATTGLLTSYLGSGTGTFTPATGASLSVGTAAPGVSVADLTGDGTLDAVVPDNTAGTVRVHPGDGQGNFGAAVQTLSLPGALRTWTADMNGDGALDIVVVTGGSGALNGNVFVLLRNSTGGFQPAVQAATGATQLATGDLNNDGTLDLALMDLGISGTDPKVQLLLNQALPTAPTISNFTPTSTNPGAVVTVSGTNFTGATAVLLGGVPTSFAVNSASSLQFFVPAAATGQAALVTVITPNGTATGFVPFTAVLATRRGANALAVTTYPNPAHGRLFVQLVSPGAVHLTLYNQLGQQVRRAAATSGSTPLSFDLTGVAPGLYTLRVQTGERMATQRILVE
ncbi:FG-GAP-like repeat-containing protein [Hymenobacter sp. CRA2]|uniref:FG-GAP-like repeat-containing protein n=1 Tax=Hymenobacter sp. CRA2 TaxID=1955620 RepID=UPI00098F4B7B|nr:FG-GAP-like repeat-containing protein [Hymenobacter sp. CRA2]OON70074.1 hypothetical protein B0919_04845 [Hymenobacter sp. CRA2]